MKLPHRRTLGKTARIVVGLLLLVGLLYMFGFGDVVTALSSIGLADLVILFALSVPLIYVSVVKWRAFLSHLGIEARVGHLFQLYLVGYFVNLIMPSALGGDIVRSLYVGRNVDRVRAVSATLLERYTGCVAMIAMALGAVWWAPQATPGIRFAVVLVACAAIVGTIALRTGISMRVLSLLRAPAGITAKVARLQDGIEWGLKDRGLLIKAGFLSVVFHLLTVVNTAAVAHAVGWTPIPWGDLLVVVPIILIVSALPFSPQGLGIQEGAFLFFLHSVGATTGEALAVGLVLRAKSYVLAALGGLLWLRMKGSLFEETRGASAV